MNKSKLMIIGVALLMITACGGSSEDIDTVAAGMMTGSDPVSEKDAKCMAKVLKRLLAMINGMHWLKAGLDEICLMRTLWL